MSMLVCPIIPDRKIAFVAIPKNAGTSIRVAFGIAQGFAEDGEVVLNAYSKPWPSVGSKAEIVALGGSGYLRFCVCRNPWERFVSFWQNKGRSEVFVSESGGLFRPGMGFPDFVEAAFSVPDEVADRHYRTQTSYIFDESVLLVDRVLRFENLEAEWEALRSEYALPVLPHYKKTGAQDSYLSVYEAHPETVEAIRLRYQRDAEYFDYVFR